MDSNSNQNKIERLSQHFSKLWESGNSFPDVFAFLSSHPNSPNTDRLEVLLVDQRQRWQRGRALPLRIYLSAFPDIAAHGEMVRALVDGERYGRQRTSGRSYRKQAAASCDSVSEAPTQSVEFAPDDTEVDRNGLASIEAPIGLQPVPDSDDRSTTTQSDATRDPIARPVHTLAG